MWPILDSWDTVRFTPKIGAVAHLYASKGPISRRHADQ
jgi:hypothetical protein